MRALSKPVFYLRGFSVPGFKHILSIGLVGIMLSGCSGAFKDFDFPDQSFWEQGFWSSSADTAEEGQFEEPAYDSEYDRMARGLSSSSVELYSLDDGASGPLVGGPVAAPSPSSFSSPDRRRPVTGDPNVTIYDLDDGQPLHDRHSYDRSYDHSMRDFRDIPPMRPLSSAGYDSPFARDHDQRVGYDTDLPPGIPHRIHFRHGSSTVDVAGQRVIQDVARGAHGGRITVTGHASERAEAADPIARRIINLQMSMNRALSVAQALIREGVPAAMIETRAYGDTRPALAEAGMDAEAASRRVELYTGGGMAFRQSGPAPAYGGGAPTLSAQPLLPY